MSDYLNPAISGAYLMRMVDKWVAVHNGREHSTAAQHAQHGAEPADDTARCRGSPTQMSDAALLVI